MPVRWVSRREGTGREWEVGGRGWDNTAEEEEPARPAPSLRTLRRQREPAEEAGPPSGRGLLEAWASWYLPSTLGEVYPGARRLGIFQTRL